MSDIGADGWGEHGYNPLMNVNGPEPVKPRGTAARLWPSGIAGALLLSLVLSVAAMLLFRNPFFVFLVFPLAPLAQLWRRLAARFGNRRSEREN